MKTFNIIIAGALAMCAAAMPPAVLRETPCTSGTPTTTAGYPISYSQATPTQFVGQAYQPALDWASSHILGTYTYGVPLPTETGFAYAQYKCQFKCNSFEGSSFFVKYGDDMMDPDTFVADEQAMVGAWNSLCNSATN
ncbi:hypothetical protein PG994_008956 [Apiospora phragmitis]|uniref:Uncharacterized protein n=1 Tax=Apiospora phragmitis TaxID=2905665 RepID=A0ABR1UHY0_9PEZI